MRKKLKFSKQNKNLQPVKERKRNTRTAIVYNANDWWCLRCLNFWNVTLESRRRGSGIFQIASQIRDGSHHGLRQVTFMHHPVRVTRRETLYITQQNQAYIFVKFRVSKKEKYSQQKAKKNNKKWKSEKSEYRFVLFRIQKRATIAIETRFETNLFNFLVYLLEHGTKSYFLR